MYDVTAHVSGYRTKADTYTIVIPGPVRKFLRIQDKMIYLFDFDLIKKTVTVVDG